MTTSRLLLVFYLLFSTNLVESADRPNIIYIMVDDLGYGDLGCYGQKVIKTPHIDQLAREGMKFTDHYSGHTVCRPSSTGSANRSAQWQHTNSW